MSSCCRITSSTARKMLVAFYGHFFIFFFLLLFYNKKNKKAIENWKKIKKIKAKRRKDIKMSKNDRFYIFFVS